MCAGYVREHVVWEDHCQRGGLKQIFCGTLMQIYLDRLKWQWLLSFHSPCCSGWFDHWFNWHQCCQQHHIQVFPLLSNGCKTVLSQKIDFVNSYCIFRACKRLIWCDGRDSYMHHTFKGIYTKFRGDNGRISNVLFENIYIEVHLGPGISLCLRRKCQSLGTSNYLYLILNLTKCLKESWNYLNAAD